MNTFEKPFDIIYRKVFSIEIRKSTDINYKDIKSIIKEFF